MKKEAKLPNKYLILGPIVLVLSLIMIFFLYSGSVANTKLIAYKALRETIDKDSAEFKEMAWAVVEGEYGYSDSYEECKVTESVKLWFEDSYHYAKYTFTYQGKKYVVIMPYSFEDENILKK